MTTGAAIRPAEVLLWIVPGAVVATASALLRPIGIVPALGFWWLLFGVAALAAGSYVRLRSGVREPALLPAAALLAAVGLAMMARIEPALLSNPDAPDHLLARHLVSVLLGLAAACVTVGVVRRPESVGRYKYTWLLIGLVLMAGTLVFGQEIRGARLWLRLGPVQVQPSELMRLAVVIFFAGYLAERRDLVAADLRFGPIRLPPVPYLLPLVLAAAGTAAILVLQNDLGTALLLFGTLLSMLFAATGQARYVALGLVAFAGLAGVAGAAVTRLGIRLQNWFDPWVDPLASGFQQVQAEYALSAGGALGGGLGRGMPHRIPDVHTDFVLAAVGEELGLAGTLAVVALLLLVAVRGFVIALRAPAGIGRFLAVGLAASIAWQSLLIAAGVARLLPLTGLTLPFVSYGGTSMLANFLTVGLLLTVAGVTPPGRMGT